jgi:crotonobetainyl-CoA:carnitine CoA-transferase CaiB-like acyl-CoA transferase
MWQTGLGGHGPYYTYKSYGILVQHMSGVSLLTGSPGSPPGTVNTSYSDYHTGVLQPTAIIGALIRRRHTGKTATMESSIFKSGAVTSGPSILDYQTNSRLPERLGNRDPRGAPHGVYPCAGKDRYCAIAVFTDREWDAFCGVLGNPSWSREARFATSLDRMDNQDELDELVGRWTSQHVAEDVMEKMQAAGVAASIVSQGQDLYEDAHLKARGFYRETRYYETERGKVASEWKAGTGIGWSMPAHLSETPMEFGHYSNVGEDNPYVFQELLGMSPAEVRRLADEEVVF